MTRQSQSTRKLRAPRWPVGMVPWRETVEHFLEMLSRRFGAQIEIVGATRSAQDGDDVSFEVPGSAGSAAAALTVNSDGTVTPGTILGVIPKIGTTPISDDPPPALTLPGTGTHYVIATVSGTPVTSTLSTYVYTHSLSDIAVVLSVSATAPVSGDLLSSTGSYVFLLATVVAGAVTNNGHGPIGGGVDDILDGTGTAALVLTYPGS